MNDEANNGFALLNEQRAQVEISSACIRALADVAHLSDINAVSDSYPLLKRHLELQLVEDEGYAEQIRAANNVEAAALYGVYADLLENQIVRSIEKQICTPVEAAEVNAELRNSSSQNHHLRKSSDMTIVAPSSTASQFSTIDIFWFKACLLLYVAIWLPAIRPSEM